MTFKAIIRKDVIYKNNTSPLCIQFLHDGRKKTIGLGISIAHEYWNAEAQKVTDDCPDRDNIQFQITAKIKEYNKKIQRLEALDVPVNFDTLFETNKSRHAGITIEDGFKAEIERLESLGKINSATKHKYALQVLDGYKSVKTALEAIDLDYLKGLELYLRQRGNKGNSIATRFAIFKAIYNKAVKEGKVAAKQNPFTLFQVGSLWAKTRKRAIDKDDIQRLIDLEITEGHKTEYQRLARDLFLFSYFTAGMNFGDIARLRYKDIVKGRVNYSRHKTQKLLSFRLRTEHRADYREVKQGRPRTGRLYPPYPRPLGTQDSTADFQPDRRRPQNRFHDKITRYVSPSAPLSHVFSSPRTPFRTPHARKRRLKFCGGGEIRNFASGFRSVRSREKRPSNPKFQTP